MVLLSYSLRNLIFLIKIIKIKYDKYLRTDETIVLKRGTWSEDPLCRL
jgi:hypothetical protein